MPETIVKERGHRTLPRQGPLMRLLGGWSVGQYELRGAMQCGEHVLERLRRLPTANGNKRLYEDWVASEFTYPLRALLWGSSRDRRAHMMLNLLVVAGGFATSGIATASGSGQRGSTTSWIVFGIGLALALVGGANQLFRPGYRANERTAAAVELRENGWAFAMSTGDYAGDDVTAFAVFQQKIATIQRQIAKISTLESQPQTTRGAAARGGRRRNGQGATAAPQPAEPTAP